MPRQTRAVFLQHQAAIRPGVPQPTFLTEWNAKAATQRETWVDMFQRIDPVRNAANVQDADFVGHRNWVINTANNAAHTLTVQDDFVTFFEGIENTLNSLSELRARWRALRKVWRQFNDEEGTHQLVHPASTAHNNAEIARITVDLNNIPNAVDHFARLRQWPPMPIHDPDGNPRIPEKWPDLVGEQPNDRDNLRISRAHGVDVAAGHLGLAIPGHGNWEFWRRMEGGLGFGGLWLRFDQNDNVVDRVFRKTVIPPLEEWWRDPIYWQGDVRDLVNRMPMEMACHTALREVEGVVQPRYDGTQFGFVDNDYMAYRFYTTFCGHRSLSELIHQSIADNRPLPEPFIWAVAENLARAGWAMAESANNPDHDSICWGEIVHRDIKPDNVFLAAVPGSQSGDIYPYYPRALLGDFGLSVRISPNDQGNPAWYQRAGTTGFHAPEQRRFIHSITREYIAEWPLGEHTNVFGYGIVLRCLLTRQQDPPIPWYLGDGDNDTALDIPAGLPYSDDLQNLIRHCLWFDYKQRPSFEQILEHIWGSTKDEAPGPNNPNLGRGMRSGSASLHARGLYAVAGPHDLYAVGLARGGVPAPVA